MPALLTISVMKPFCPKEGQYLEITRHDSCCTMYVTFIDRKYEKSLADVHFIRQNCNFNIIHASNNACSMMTSLELSLGFLSFEENPGTVL